VRNPGTNERETADEAAGWSVRKMVVWGVVFFVVQVGFIYATGSRPDGMAPPQPKGPAVHWIPAAISPEALATFFGVPDPAGAVLPGYRGFSGEAWLRLPALPQVRVDWVDATHWLSLRTNTLGQAYAMLPQESRPLLAASEESDLPALLQPPVLPLPAPLRTESNAELSAVLRDRLEEPLPPIPDQTSSELLKDSAVVVAVNAEGRVLTARLAERSGGSESAQLADQSAVKLAMGLSFKPSAGAPLATGLLRIQWNTVLPKGAPQP
jgi:hypothetical protein